MKNGLPVKSRVAAVSRVRKTAMMSAAATALIAATPAFADALANEASLQATIRNILRTPVKQASWRAKTTATTENPIRFSAVDIGNSDDISVGADEAAIGHAESVEDINVVNTGNLTGGIGIEVSTGAIDFNDAYFDDVMTHVGPSWDAWQFLYDDNGNHILDEYGNWAQVAINEVSYEWRSTVLNPDSAASTITIDNRGSIAFSGQHGIKANNPAGESITISNSGDITSTADLTDRIGIYASTESIGGSSTNTLTQAGEFTHNAYGQLTGVISPDQFSSVTHGWDMLLDGGTIDVHNTGDIDMGPAEGYAGYRHMGSVGIYTRGDGGTTIVNEGNIRVGDYSAGIKTLANGATSITNSGRIEVGNSSDGVLFDESAGSVDFYRLGGDVYILNTGDIVGGETKAETPPGEYTGVGGIRVFSAGSNNPTLASVAELNQLITQYNEILGEEVFQTYDIPYVRLYTTMVVNQGRIELQDGARAIAIQPNAGDSIAINEGTIIVGEGTTNFRGNYHDPAAGIWNSNLPVDARGLVVSINTATGVIHTGDDGAGLTSQSYRGDSIAINEGIITTGDGVVGQVEDYYTGIYDKLFHSNGIMARSADYYVGTTAYARNSGSITVGDLAIGSGVIGMGWSLLDPDRITALNVNEGIIESGDNSAGMFTRGTNASSINSGTITSGSYDISAFTPNEFSADVFAVGRNGVGASGARLSEVVNYGTITTGDGKVGASAVLSYDWGYGSRIIQSGDGIITTGDHSIGARVTGDDFALLTNEGRISVGDDSVGADITAGGALKYTDEATVTVTEGILQASNAGIIETGDNSVGVRMNGDRKDVPWWGYVLEVVQGPYGDYYVYQPVSGTVDITNASYLENTGTIRVGTDSAAVEITGAAGSEQGLHLFNAGSINASQVGSTAVSVNADNDLGSGVVNIGTIAGNMTFGAGDDQLMNTRLIDNAGRVTHSGNIVMNGSVIDFGAGDNRFDVDRSVLTLAGGDNLVNGADLFLNQASIEARNNAADSSLTINGNVSGDFVFGADVSGGGNTDRMIITGDVADGSSMGIVINTTEQLKGDGTFTVISIDGDNNGDAHVSGVTGDFADSVQDAEVVYEDGEVIVTARFGMGHMATSMSAATSLAQHWWMQSVGSLDKRDMQQLAGLQDSGLSVWATMFHEEGAVNPGNDLQDVSFDQSVFGLQTGIEWKGDVGGGSFNVGPMFTYGNASAHQNANLANAKGDASAYGLNAGYRFGNGLYLNAAWQQMSMAIDFRTPDTLSNATGTTDAEGDGFNVELGYAHKLGSGLTLAPQLQYSSVTMEVDDFTSSDDVYELSGIGGKHSLLRAGLAVFKTFETTNGSITPLVDVSYLDALDGESTLASNGIQFGNDTSGSGYRAEFGVAGRYKGWDISGRVGVSDTAAIKSALSSNLTVRYRW